MKRAIRKTVQRILSAKKPAWIFLIRSLQACCLLLLLAALFQLLGETTGEARHLQTAYIFRDLSQIALLLGALVPPCLEELRGKD